MRFVVTARWDEDVKVFYSESTIIGLHVEAPTLEEFENELQRLAPALVVANHISKQDMSQRSLLDLIPSIFLRVAARTGTAAA